MKCYLWLMIAGGALSVLSTALRAQGATGEGRIRILADNVAGGLGSDWPMYCGVPCPRGMLKDPRQVRVVDAQGQPAPTQARVLSRWAGTDDVRWLGVDFLGDPNRPYFVERTAPGAEGWDSLIARQGNDFVINTGPARFVVPSSGPLIARAYLDLNGDGKFTEDEMVIQNVGGDDLYVVDNRGRKAIAGKDASAEQAVSEPENASVHACVRREGWYVTDSGDKVARHITRLHFCRGKSFVRIQHTLVLTEDTNKLWFRDIGVRFGHRIPDAAKVTFDASHEFDDAALTTTLAGADRVAYLFQEKYFSFSRMDPEKDARFVIAKVGESAEAVLKTGQRCGEWVDVSGEKAGVALAVRHLWQQFPKELEVSPDAVTARLWSSRGGRELDVRMETLLKGWPEEWLNKTYHKAADVDALRKASTQGLGMARTHELLLYLHPGNAAAGKVKQVCHAFEKPVLCLADPWWLYRSEAMGPIYPYDPQKFPAAEAWFEACFDQAAKVIQSWGDFGFLEFGSGPHCWYRVVTDGPLKGRMIPYLDRYFADYGFCAQVWVPYIRSGKRKFYEMAEEVTQERMDVQMVHWDDPKATLERFTNVQHGRFRGGFGMGSFASPTRLGNATYLHYHSGGDVRMLPYSYYLCDNRQAWDVFQDYRALVKRVWKREPGDTADHAPYDYSHRVGGTLRCLACVYQETGDEEILALGKDWVSKLVDVKQPLGMDLARFENIGQSKWEVKAHALARWFEATGDDLARQAVLRISQTHADLSMGDLPNSYYTARGYYLGMAYRLTADPSYARILRRNVDLTVAHHEAVMRKVGASAEGLGLAATGVGAHVGGPSIRSGGLQDLPFALDALSRYERQHGQPPPATPILQQASHGPVTFALFEKPAGESIVLDVRSWYPFAPEVKTLTGQTLTGIRCEGLIGEMGYVSESRYTSAPHSYRLTLPADVPGGVYMLDPRLGGAPWEVTWTNAGKIVLYAPRGLILGGGESWPPRQFRAGGAFPARPVLWFFTVPKDARELQIYLAKPCQLFKPDGQSVQVEDAPWRADKPGWIRLPAVSGRWSIRADEATFVELRGAPPVFACEEPSRHFQSASGGLPEAKPAPAAPPTEAKAGDYAKGVFERREPNLGLLLTGKRALRLDRGKPLEPQRFERFNGREGTLELWFKPNWSSAYSTGVRTLLDGDGWRIRLYPYNVAFQVDAANWKTGMWSGARACITSVGTWFDAGRWTHLAFQWHWSASGGQRFFLEVYVDGRLQNVGSALIRDVERDHIDNKYIQDGFPGTAAFAPKPISEQLTLGHGLDGVMDELRISDARRYPADFAPDRQSPFKPDAHTLALFHLDGSAKGERGTDGVPVAAELMGK